MTTVQVPERVFKKLLQAADIVTANAVVWINEAQCCELLDISRKTLGNYVRMGKITRDMLTVGVGSNMFFDRIKLLD